MNESEELLVVKDTESFTWGTHFHIYKWNDVKANKRGEGPRAKCNICHLPASHDTIVNSGEGKV